MARRKEELRAKRKGKVKDERLSQLRSVGYPPDVREMFLHCDSKRQQGAVTVAECVEGFAEFGLMSDQELHAAFSAAATRLWGRRAKGTYRYSGKGDSSEEDEDEEKVLDPMDFYTVVRDIGLTL